MSNIGHGLKYVDPWPITFWEFLLMICCLFSLLIL